MSNADTAAQQRTQAYKQYLETAPSAEIQERIEESAALQGYPEGGRMPLTKEQERTQSALLAEQEYLRGKAERDEDLIIAVNKARRGAATGRDI